MSRAEIISEIPKLSHADRRAILRRIMEVESDSSEMESTSSSQIKVHSLKGHRVLTPKISQSELADEMFSRQ
jgi:hypothetical protein